MFDVQDPRFLHPGDMPARIAGLCAEQGLRAPGAKAELMRSIVESLAYAFASALDSAERLAGRPIRIVHVVGGGSLNRLLCQAIADRSGRPVLAGPVEATALGNVLVQGRDARCSLRIAGGPAVAHRAHPRPRALRAQSMIDV